MYNKLEKNQSSILDTVEVDGEFIIEKRYNGQCRRKRNAKHWQRYDRRLQQRRSSIHSRVDIEV